MIDFQVIGHTNKIVYVKSDEILIKDGNSALDLMMTVRYTHDCGRIIVNIDNVVDELFKLNTKIAGDVFQKFINYHSKLAIIGDYSKFTSKSLKDLIYECNKGNDIFFVSTLEEAISKLTNTK